MANPTKEQTKRWNQAYYQKNKDKRKDQYNKWRRDMRTWLKELKKTLSCLNCGFSHPAALAFHHRDQRAKLEDVGNMIKRGFPKEKILEEIKKCDVLCHNCHAIHHHGSDID